MGSGGPSAPSSVIGSDSRDTESGAGSSGGDPAARDIHLGVRGQGQVSVGHSLGGAPNPSGTYLATSTSAADGETVCSSSPGSR